jgi:hypothetical protein
VHSREIPSICFICCKYFVLIYHIDSVGFLITALPTAGVVIVGLSEKMVSAQLMSGNLNNSFNALMVSGGGESGQAQNGGTCTLSGWKDLPMELLLRIISVAGDDRMVIVASGVCTGWRDALGWGVTNLSFSWLVICISPSYVKMDRY